MTGYECPFDGHQLLQLRHGRLLIRPGNDPNDRLKDATYLRLDVEVCEYCGRLVESVPTKVLAELKRAKELG